MTAKPSLHHDERDATISTITSQRKTLVEALSVLPEQATRFSIADKLLVSAGMVGWNVRTVPVSATEVTDTGVTSLDLPKKAAVVYTDTTHAVGEIVGTGYTPIQNEAMPPFLDALVNLADGGYTAAGFRSDHSRVWVNVQTPCVLTIGGYDQVAVNLLVSNSPTGPGRLASAAI